LVWLARKQGPRLLKHNLMDEPLYLKPGAFALAQTREVFNLPDYIACEFRLKSSGARAGLDQALAVWIDPGFNGSVLTLELRNNLQDHTLVLEYGMPIGQLIFWKGDPVPAEKSYRTIGQYNGDKEAQPSKGVR
ncbi:MAG: dCTP deaminase, partial [Candidatus Roseilinea sp.]|uniref:dCTP deaminase n=1 Tax=Candidatus Roseilinea sp. TaxID=2838777 RepID=UPI00404B3F83